MRPAPLLERRCTRVVPARVSAPPPRLSLLLRLLLLPMLAPADLLQHVQRLHVRRRAHVEVRHAQRQADGRLARGDGGDGN